MIGRVKKRVSERQAAKNAARLFSGKMSLKDESRMMGWSKKSTPYGDSFHDTMRIMAELEVFADDADLLSLAAANAEQPKSASMSGYWPGLAVAALLLVVAITGFWMVQPGSSDSENAVNVQRYVTRTGEQKTVNLEDGSTITLNTATQLLVDITDEARNIVLLRGEAYFDVKKDSNRPFTVDLGRRSVSALGTAFNILNLPEKFIVAVTEGEVAIHRRDDDYLQSAPLLNPPQGEVVRIQRTGTQRAKAGTVLEFVVDKQELAAYQVKDANRMQSWRSGVIRFDATPLYKVVQELNRYSAKKILIEDASIMNMDLYITVQLDHLSEAVLAFEQALPVKVIQRFDSIVIVRKEE